MHLPQLSALAATLVLYFYNYNVCCDYRLFSLETGMVIGKIKVKKTFKERLSFCIMVCC